MPAARDPGIATQVSDDPQLLNLMLEAIKLAPDIFKPTNYWSVIEKKLLPALYSIGLHDFRRRKSPPFRSMGATDLNPMPEQIDLARSRLFNNRYTKNLPFWSKLLSVQNYLLNKMLPTTATYGISIEDLRTLAYAYVRTKGEDLGAKSIDQFDGSVVGNPVDIIKVGGKTYTRSRFS